MKKRFIELTERDEGYKVVFPIETVKSVMSDKRGFAVVELGENKHNETVFFTCKETYEKVKSYLTEE